MNYDEFKEFSRKSWEEDYNYLRIDKSKKRDHGRYCICNESKKTYIECTPETKPLGKHDSYSHNYSGMYNYKVSIP